MHGTDVKIRNGIFQHVYLCSEIIYNLNVIESL